MNKLIILILLLINNAFSECVITEQNTHNMHNIEFYSGYIQINGKYTASFVSYYGDVEIYSNRSYTYSFLHEDGELYVAIEKYGKKLSIFYDMCIK